MKVLYLLSLVLCLGSTALAGTPMIDTKQACPVVPPEPDFGRVTLGGKFSSQLNSGFIDVVQGLQWDENHALFMNLRGTMGDNQADVFSAGLGFRALLEQPEVIVGGHVFYDHLSSAAGNGFNQLGFGAEVLSQWIDARFNYYLPETGRKQTGAQQATISGLRVSEPYTQGGYRQRDVIRDTSTVTLRTFEQAIGGWNAEIGFLVPGVKRWFDLRLFAGAYGYDNPAGGRYEGFKGRAEARVTRNLFLDLEYWQDAELVGGHWVTGVRYSAPFDLGRLLQGRNPFKDTTPAPTPSLRSRLDDQIMRSHRVMTGTSAPQPGDVTVTTTSQVVGITDQQAVGTAVVNGGEETQGASGSYYGSSSSGAILFFNFGSSYDSWSISDWNSFSATNDLLYPPF